MNTLKSSFTKRSFKAGAMSMALMAAAVAIVIVVNLLFAALPSAYTKLDVTNASLYKLTKEAEALIASFDQEITIKYLVSDSNRDTYIDELLRRAAELNEHIHITTIDPVLHPDQVTNYTAYGQNSFVVSSEQREKVVGYSDIYKTQYYYEGQEISAEEYNQYAAYYQYGMIQSAPTTEQSFAGETLLASALAYVTTDKIPVIYTLSGHNEISMDQNLAGYLADDNVDVKALQLATEDKVPDDANAVMILVPQSDLSETECERLDAYIKSGGHVIIYTYYQYDVGENLEQLLNSYGMQTVQGLVMETDSTMYNQNYAYLYPSVMNHAFTARLSGKYVFAPLAHGIVKTEQTPENVTVSPLLQTSEGSFACSELDNDAAATIEKMEGDVDGPFMIGAAAEYAPEQGSAGGLTWYSTPYLTNPQNDANGAVSDLFLTTAESTCEIETSVTLATKKLTTNLVSASTQDRVIWGLIMVGVLPVGVIALGLFVWTKRRKR